MLKYLQRLKLKFYNLLKRIVLPGFEGENLYDVGRFFYRGLSSGAVGSRAASVTFRFLLALFPMIICVFSLIPFVPIENFQNDVLDYIRNFFPKEVYAFFDDALVDLIKRKRTLLLSVGFLVTIYFASSGINAMLDAFSSSKHLEIRRKAYKQQLWSVAIFGILMGASLLLTLLVGFGETAIDYLFQHNVLSGKMAYIIMIAFHYAIILLLYLGIISLLYNVGHTERTRWKFFSVGAIASAVSIILLQKSFSIYLTNFANFDKLYGPLGAAIGFLLFFYYLFYLLIIGFELNVSIHGSKKSKKQ